VPGYEVKTIDGGVSPGTHFSFAVPGPLLAYDHATGTFRSTRDLFGNPGPAPQMAVSEGAAVATTGDGPADGFDFFTFTTPGDHAHLFHTLYGDGSTPSNGPDAVYALPLQLKSGALAPSETYYLLLGKGFEPGSPLFDEAAAAARQTLLGSLRGDVNFDGRVNALDLLLVRRHLGGQEGPWDVTGDGRVNVLDLRLVRDAMRRSGAAPGVASALPEPGVFALIGLGAAALLRRRR
jgi:MYXO-CTERM domain-containing protein